MSGTRASAPSYRSRGNTPGGSVVSMQSVDIDLSDLEFWARPLDERAAAFATLRAQPELAFFAEPESPGMPQGPGYRRPHPPRRGGRGQPPPRAVLLGPGHQHRRHARPEFLEFFGSMINMDDPRHARFRRIVSRAFTPRFLESLKADVAGDRGRDRRRDRRPGRSATS